MAYRSDNRYQIGLLPHSIEEYVADDDPVRAYDAFVEALDFHELGIEIDRHKETMLNTIPGRWSNCLSMGIRMG
jgi:hypothetical protein